ncbi:MAG TPA: hypothetical protein VFP37_17790 [Steroidobacteraceae bacterium]|nr:hypothetical protein [Steroidobacteraceae bacterium]
MYRPIATCLLLSLALAAAGCVNEREMRKREITKFQQTAAGEYTNEAGETLFIAPVYARMIALDTVYVERTTAAGTSGRLVALEISGDGERVVQIAYVFTTQGQWRNLREQPELFSALLPNDVRPAGTCDIKLADDMNSISYSCGGSPPVNYQRVHHPLPD